MDLLGIARELLRWPARIWMTVAEALGKVILAAWMRGVLPAWRVVRRALRVALAFGERTVTPARGLAVVALAATITLGASQFGNYRAVEVGKPAYTKVEDVAQAPQVAKAMPRSAHGIWVFAIAVAFAVRHRVRRLAQLPARPIALVPGIGRGRDKPVHGSPRGPAPGNRRVRRTRAPRPCSWAPSGCSSSRARPWRSWGPCSPFSCEPSGRCAAAGPARTTSARSLAGRPG